MAAIQLLQCWILTYIQTGQLVFKTSQLLQCRILTYIQTGQLVFPTNQFLQHRILAHIQFRQPVMAAVQYLQVWKKLKARQVTDVLILDIDLSDCVPLCRCQNTVTIFVKLFEEIFPERFVRDISISDIDGAVTIRSRKGAEGQKGEHHCQRQQGADKARSF